MMCTKMVPEEEDRVEKFIGGLPNNIQGNVIAAEPTKLQDAVRIANNLMDQKLKGYVVKKCMKNNTEGWRSIRETTMDSNHHSKGQMLEVRMWQEPIRLETMRENRIMDHCLSATSVSFTMKGHALVCVGKCIKGLRMKYRLSLKNDMPLRDKTIIALINKPAFYQIIHG
ncbi:hypothetical protein Tco_0985944 [Tanacetum coccineum]